MTDSQDARSAVFARKVRQLRNEHGWSQAELGRRAGLGQSRTAAIEATGSVTIDQAQDFADALHVPIEVLLYENAPVTEAVQVQELHRIAATVDQLRDEIARLIGGISSKTILAVVVGLLLVGCGGGGTTASHATVTVTARPVQPAVIDDTSTPPGSRFCHRLESAPDEAAYYASEVMYQAKQAGGDLAAGKTIVALWITISCPQFTYLTKEDQ